MPLLRTVTQRVSVSPGLMLLTLNVAWPVTRNVPSTALLSRATVPAVQELPGLVVVAVKAAFEPCHTSRPATRRPTAGAAVRISRRPEGVEKDIGISKVEERNTMCFGSSSRNLEPFG